MCHCFLDETQYNHINDQKVPWVGVGLEGVGGNENRGTSISSNIGFGGW
jgi:hypothetical protein